MISEIVDDLLLTLLRYSAKINSYTSPITEPVRLALGIQAITRSYWKGSEVHSVWKGARFALLARVFVFLGLTVSVARAGESWTFCVAESADPHEIWITSVFRAAKDRERLETDFQAYLEQHDVAHAVVQCPAPKREKTEVVDAQFTAVGFHRKLGDTIHTAVVPGFESTL